MVNQPISTSIVKYLINKKGYSVKGLAKLTNSSIIHIKNIILKKTLLTKKDMDLIIENTRIKHWELLYYGVDKGLLSSVIKKRIKICKQLDEIAREKNNYGKK